MTHKTMYLFPGTGSACPGMGTSLSHFPEAKAIYTQASDHLHFDVAEVSFGKDMRWLSSFPYQSVALLTHQIACHALLQERVSTKPHAIAGLSMGEYSALVASNALSFEDALTLLWERGHLLPGRASGKLKVFPRSGVELHEVAQAHGCYISCYNSPRQAVVGGREEDLAQLTPALDGLEGFLLSAPAAFHTPLVQRLQESYRPILENTPFHDLEIPVFSCLTGSLYPQHGQPDLLLQQLISPVQWQLIMEHAFQEGVTTFIEVGGTLHGSLGSITRDHIKGKKEVTTLKIKDETVQDVLGRLPLLNI